MDMGNGSRVTFAQSRCVTTKQQSRENSIFVVDKACCSKIWTRFASLHLRFGLANIYIVPFGFDIPLLAVYYPRKMRLLSQLISKLSSTPQIGSKMGLARNLQVHFSQNLHFILASIYDGRLVLSS
jgi:hypothetical protein